MENYTLATYQIKIKDGNSWELVDQGGRYFGTVGDGLAFLNRVYDLTHSKFKNDESILYENIFYKDFYIFWKIENSENTYSGITEITNGNFLEKVIKFDLSEYAKSKFVNVE